MSIITHTIASFADGLVQAQIDLDDATLQVVAARAINNSDFPAVFEVYKAGNLRGDLAIPAHTTRQRNIPGNLRFAMDSGDPAWGIPPEMTMGDIVIRVRWG